MRRWDPLGGSVHEGVSAGALRPWVGWCKRRSTGGRRRNLRRPRRIEGRSASGSLGNRTGSRTIARRSNRATFFGPAQAPYRVDGARGDSHRVHTIRRSVSPPGPSAVHARCSRSLRSDESRKGDLDERTRSIAQPRLRPTSSSGGRWSRPAPPARDRRPPSVSLLRARVGRRRRHSRAGADDRERLEGSARDLLSSAFAIPAGLLAWKLSQAKCRATDLLLGFSGGVFTGTLVLAVLGPVVALYYESSQWAGPVLAQIAIALSLLSGTIVFSRSVMSRLEKDRRTVVLPIAVFKVIQNRDPSSAHRARLANPPRAHARQPRHRRSGSSAGEAVTRALHIVLHLGNGGDARVGVCRAASCVRRGAWLRVAQRRGAPRSDRGRPRHVADVVRSQYVRRDVRVSPRVGAHRPRAARSRGARHGSLTGHRGGRRRKRGHRRLRRRTRGASPVGART